MMNEYPEYLQPVKFIREDQAEYETPDTWDTDLSTKDREILEKVFTKGLRSYHNDIERLLGLEEAIFLSQLRYLLKHNKRGIIVKDPRGRWAAFYNSYDQWLQLMPKMSKRKLQNIIGRLEKLDIIWTKRGPWQKYYGINFKALAFFLQYPEQLKEFQKKLFK